MNYLRKNVYLYQIHLRKNVAVAKVYLQKNVGVLCKDLFYRNL